MRTGAAETESIELRLLVQAIFQRYHYDFRGYSEASLKRRLSQARDRFGSRLRFDRHAVCQASMNIQPIALRWCACCAVRRTCPLR